MKISGNDRQVKTLIFFGLQWNSSVKQASRKGLSADGKIAGFWTGLEDMSESNFYMFVSIPQERFWFEMQRELSTHQCQPQTGVKLMILIQMNSLKIDETVYLKMHTKHFLCKGNNKTQSTL